METLELNGKKIAKVFIVKLTRNSCFDHTFIIRDNYEDAKRLYIAESKLMREYADKHDLVYKDDTTYRYLYDKTQGKCVFCLSLHQQRFELTDNN